MPSGLTQPTEQSCVLGAVCGSMHMCVWRWGGGCICVSIVQHQISPEVTQSRLCFPRVTFL